MLRALPMTVTGASACILHPGQIHSGSVGRAVIDDDQFKRRLVCRNTARNTAA